MAKDGLKAGKAADVAGCTNAAQPTLADVSHGWGRISCVHVMKLPGFEATQGKLFVGAVIDWPKGNDESRVESAKVIALSVLPGNLLAVTVRSTEPKYRGQVARMVLDLSSCVVVFQEPVPEKLPDGVVEVNGEVRDKALLRPAEVQTIKVAAVPGERLLQDVLLYAETGQGITKPELDRLVAAANDPEWADRRPRIVAVLRRMAEQGTVPVKDVAPVAPPAVQAEAPTSGSADDEDQDPPPPAGRIESDDPRDKVAVVMQRGQ